MPVGDVRRRLSERRGPEVSRTRASAAAAIRSRPKTLRPEAVEQVKAALDTKFGHGPTLAGHEELLLDLDRPDVRQDGRQQRDHRDHRLAAGDLGLHRAALRVEVRDPGADRADARPADHRGRVSLTGREVTTATVAALLTILGYSLYDTIIVFDRVRENVPRMPRAAFSQIVNRSMSEVLTRSLATSFCTLLPVHRAAAVRRRNAQGLRLRADGRDRLGRLLLDLHRLAGAHALEGARGRLPQPPRADRARTGRRAGLRDDRRRGARGRRARAEAQAHATRQPDRPRGARRAALARGVPGTGARPRRRGAEPARRRQAAGARAGVGERRRGRSARPAVSSPTSPRAGDEPSRSATRRPT